MQLILFYLTDLGGIALEAKLFGGFRKRQIHAYWRTHEGSEAEMFVEGHGRIILRVDHDGKCCDLSAQCARDTVHQERSTKTFAAMDLGDGEAAIRTAGTSG